MGRDYKIRQKGQTPAVDGDWAVSGAMTVDGAVTLTGALTQTGAIGAAALLTYSAGQAVGAAAAIAADGTLGGLGMYVFNGADANINMPLVATNDGLHIIVANQNGTGTATINDDATDSAALVGNGATGASFLLTPLEVIHMTAYSAGTCWFIVN